MGEKENRPLLKLRDICIFYGKNYAVGDLSLNVERGEIVALLGGNGSGKSTALKAICGLLKPASGSIELEGQDVTRLPPYELVKLGIVLVPEGRRLFPEMTVMENLRTGAQFPHSKHNFQKNLGLVFELFPLLKARQQQLAGTLSGGEGQMLAISRGLMSEPKILLLDEPSFGLAPLVVQTIGRAMIALRDRGTTILLAEQNVHLALEVAGRAYLLEVGKIALEGAADQLRSNELIAKAYLGA